MGSAVPKIVSEHFAASVATDDKTSGETLLNVSGFVDRNDLIYGTKRQLRIGRWKRLAQASHREKKTAVVVGKAHTKMALDLCYLVFASGHLNDLWQGNFRRTAVALPPRIMSAHGPSRKCSRSAPTSAFEGQAEEICSL